jgi:hypothetical protein
LYGFSKFVSNFKGASYNFEFDYFINQYTKNGKKPSAHVQKVPISYYKPSKKYLSRGTIPLSSVSTGQALTSDMLVKEVSIQTFEYLGLDIGKQFCFSPLRRQKSGCKQISYLYIL